MKAPEFDKIIQETKQELSVTICWNKETFKLAQSEQNSEKIIFTVAPETLYVRQVIVQTRQRKTNKYTVAVL